MSALEILKEQHRANVVYIRQRMARPGGLSEFERSAFAVLLNAQRSACEEAGATPGECVGGELLNESSPHVPKENTSIVGSSSSSPVEENSGDGEPPAEGGPAPEGGTPKAGRSRKR